MILTKNAVIESVHYIPGSDLVYLNNAKVACSTLKKSIWTWWDQKNLTHTFEGYPHDRIKSPFCKTLEQIAGSGLDAFLNSKFLAVVRNPFVRVLSAYLDKIASKPRDLKVWQPLARRFNYAADEIPTFCDFLYSLKREEPELLDQHFRLQNLNLLSYITEPNIIVRIEEIHILEDILKSMGIKIYSHAPHKTGASNKIAEFFGRREIELTTELYCNDFDVFGYSTDPTILEPIRPVVFDTAKKSRDKLKHYVEAHTASRFDVRVRALSELRKLAPAINSDYIGLEARIISQKDVRILGDQIVRKDAHQNWYFASKVTQALIEFNMIEQASASMQRALELYRLVNIRD